MAEQAPSIEGEAGVIPVDLSIPFSDAFKNSSTSTSSATSSSSVSSVFGDTNIASGKSAAGSLGTVKGFAFAILALAAFAIYEFVERRGTK